VPAPACSVPPVLVRLPEWHHVILSIHIPKTAGTAFGELLHGAFGSRLLRDYGDHVGLNTPEEDVRRAARIVKARARRDKLLRDFDVIHGHYTADKYAGLFPRADFVAFFREPYQQTLSQYEYILRHPEIDNPGVKLFHVVRPTRAEFIARAGNHQEIYLGAMDLDELAVVGLTEQFQRSAALFETVLGRKLPRDPARANANPDRTGEHYAVDPELQRAVLRYRAADIDLYRRARERFASLCERCGV
jgi:hypothetical protein